MLAKATAALDLISQAPGPVRLAEVAAALGMPRSSAHRLLGELTELDLVRRDDNGRYLPGVRLLGWGLTTDLRYNLRSMAQPIVEALAKQTRESVNLNVLTGERRVCVVSVRGEASLFAPIEVGETLPLGIGATGLLLLAFSPEQLQQRVLGRLAAEGRPVPSAEELAEIQERQWATSINGLRLGLAAGAALVTGPGGRAMAALTLGGEISRVNAERLEALRPAVGAAAQQISAHCTRLMSER